MQETLSTLFDLTINLADIKDKLGQEWPAFARRMETQAALFNNRSQTNFIAYEAN